MILVVIYVVGFVLAVYPAQQWFWHEMDYDSGVGDDAFDFVGTMGCALIVAITWPLWIVMGVSWLIGRAIFNRNRTPDEEESRR